MDASEPTPNRNSQPVAAKTPLHGCSNTPTSRRRRISRRALLKLAGGAAAIGFGAEFLRVVAFTNIHTVIPNRVYRTAQLKPQRLQEFIAEKGIRTVVNLRGVCSHMPWYQGECETTHTANINQEDITFSAKRFPAPTEAQRLIEVLDHTEYPIVFHCQRGADRTGLASTVARLLMTDDDLSEARRQLWPRYGHVAVGRTAVLDRFFDYYKTWLETRGESHTPERFRHWVHTDYCPGPYRAKLSLLSPVEQPASRGFTATVRAENISIEPWQFTPGAAGGIRLHFSLTATDGTVVYHGHAGQFARTVQPGEAIELVCGIPPLAAGNYMFCADLLEAEPIDLLDTAFVQYGSEPLDVMMRVT